MSNGPQAVSGSAVAPIMNHSPWAALGGVLVAVLAVAAHFPALGNGLVWDDHFVVEGAAPPPLARVLSEPFRLGEESPPYYRPLVTLTLALERSLWGAAPAGYHALNVVLHAAAALLLLRLLLRFVPPSPALLAAGIFAVHPVHVEAVSFIVGRCDLLAALLVLASLTVLCGGIGGDPAAGPPAAPRLAAGAGLFWLALLSKENAVLCAVIPPLLLLRRGGGRPSWTGALRLALPYAAAVAAYLALRLWALGLGGTRPGTGTIAASLSQYPPWLFEVVRLLVFPRRLLPYYVLPEAAPPLALLLLAVVALALAAVVALGRARRWDVPFTLGASLLILPLLPALPFLPRQGALFAERFLYLPSAGFAILLAAAADLAWRAGRGTRARGALVLIGAAAILAGAAWSALRTTDWRDDLRLYSRALGRDPDNHVLMALLADEHILGGDLAEAERLMTRALALEGSFSRAGIGLGQIYRVTGRPDEARRAYRNVLARDGNNAEALLRLGTLELQTGNLVAARDPLLRLVVLRPESLPALRALGTVEARAGARRAAEGYWRRALALAPADVGTLVNLGMLMVEEGRRDAARELLGAALALDPGQETARKVLLELDE